MRMENEDGPSNERLMRARLNGKHAKLSIIQCYAPINDADDDEKDAFYIKLQEEVEKLPAHDVLLVIGDLSTKVGNYNTSQEKSHRYAGRWHPE